MTAEPVSNLGKPFNGDDALSATRKKAGKTVDDAKRAEIKRVAVEFQSLFVEMMLKSMRETAKQDKMTGGGHGEDVYGSLLDREYAIAISRRGNLGLAEIVEKQLLSQELNVKPAVRGK